LRVPRSHYVSGGLPTLSGRPGAFTRPTLDAEIAKDVKESPDLIGREIALKLGKQYLYVDSVL